MTEVVFNVQLLNVEPSNIIRKFALSLDGGERSAIHVSQGSLHLTSSIYGGPESVALLLEIWSIADRDENSGASLTFPVSALEPGEATVKPVIWKDSNNLFKCDAHVATVGNRRRINRL